VIKQEVELISGRKEKTIEKNSKNAVYIEEKLQVKGREGLGETTAETKWPYHSREDRG